MLREWVRVRMGDWTEYDHVRMKILSERCKQARDDQGKEASMSDVCLYSSRGRNAIQFEERDAWADMLTDWICERDHAGRYSTVRWSSCNDSGGCIRYISKKDARLARGVNDELDLRFDKRSCTGRSLHAYVSYESRSIIWRAGKNAQNDRKSYQYLIMREYCFESRVYRFVDCTCHTLVIINILQKRLMDEACVRDGNFDWAASEMISFRWCDASGEESGEMRYDLLVKI